MFTVLMFSKGTSNRYPLANRIQCSCLGEIQNEAPLVSLWSCFANQLMHNLHLIHVLD